ncbi:MAG: hypothetical protein HUJ69_06050, partial [Lachnospiraceae bacterium]|nr:hypothetical protein [Lachnospiraceae bacterium]
KQQPQAAKKDQPENSTKQQPLSKAPELKDVEAVIENKQEAEMVLKIIHKYKTKQGVSNALSKLLKDSEKAGRIYKLIKPLIADKKGQ